MGEFLSGGTFAAIVPYFWLVLGLGVLIISGNWLVTGSVQLARYFKISTFIVGLTIVAYGTSAPEMFISIGAALNNVHDIALGNVIGSNIANIGFVLAVVMLICPIPVRDRSILFDLVVMLVLTLLLFVLAFDGTLAFPEGLAFVVILAVYTVWSVVKARRKIGPGQAEEHTMKPPLAALLVAAAVVGLYFGAEWFLNGARAIALQWGVSERVIGISVVALGTSAPELVASLVAIFRKEAGLSIGNIIGSNLFNIAGVLGVTAIIRPLTVSDRVPFVTDMLWLFGISAALVLAMLPLSKGRLSRREGAVLLALFIVYIVLLFYRG